MQSIKWGSIVVLSAALGLGPVLAAAGDKPSPEEARKVLDYYYHGKGMSPVLVETKICHDVQREGDEKNECAGDISGQPVKKGDSVYIWMAFMAPNGGDTQSAIVQLELNGVARWVRNVQVPGQLRARTWLKYTFEKAGNWKVKIAQDNGNSVDQLGTLDVNVAD